MAHALQQLRATLCAAIARLSSLSIPSLGLHRTRALALVFMPLLLANCANGLLVLHTVDTLSASQRLISHTYEIQTQISVVETRLLDAEDALRGYLLTGDTAYLVPHVSDRGAITVEIAQLRILTAGDITEQRQIATLEPLVGPLMSAWQRAIGLRARQQTAQALALMRTGQVQRETTQIRTVLDEMDGTEAHALTAEQRAADSSVNFAHTTLLIAIAADIALLAALFVLVWHAFAERERHLQAESAARKAAEEAVALRDQFLSVASHELRTPIAILLGNIQLLERFLSARVELDERIQELFVAIQRQIARLQALIAAMLDVSRIERGQLSIAHDPLDLVALVRAVVDDTRPTAPEHPLELTVPSDPPPVIFLHGDAFRLEQALLNLLQNAIKFSPDGSPVRVEVKRAADWATVSVSDSGIGIAEDALAHVFEQFYRAPDVRSNHISGMGIGLYLVQEIVVLHGGKVTVTSERGVGTTFTVQLPLAPPHISPH